MELTREQIVKGMHDILGAEAVITDEKVLKESSNDRYRKYEQCMGVFTQPIPAAVMASNSSGRQPARGGSRMAISAWRMCS